MTRYRVDMRFGYALLTDEAKARALYAEQGIRLVLEHPDGQEDLLEGPPFEIAFAQWVRA